MLRASWCKLDQASRQDVHSFLADDSWSFPSFHRVKTRALRRMFDPRRIASDDPDKLKGSCSEFLALYGLLRHWVETEVPEDPALQPQRCSFQKLCSVLDLILQIKRGLVSPAVGAPRLATECSDFLRLRKD